MPLADHPFGPAGRLTLGFFPLDNRRPGLTDEGDRIAGADGSDPPRDLSSLSVDRLRVCRRLVGFRGHGEAVITAIDLIVNGVTTVEETFAEEGGTGATQQPSTGERALLHLSDGRLRSRLCTIL